MIDKNHNREAFNKWFHDRGDITKRLDYDLTADSIVLDVGGYQGNYAQQIFDKFNSTIHVFEPMKQFSDHIGRRFAGNTKVSVYPVGISNKTENLTIFIPEGQDEATLHPGETSIAREEAIRVIDVVEIFEKLELNYVDLMKINIEGAEFDLLDRLIESKLHEKITDIQIQYHKIGNDSEDRRNLISSELSHTHECTWNYPWIWENWKLK